MNQYYQNPQDPYRQTPPPYYGQSSIVKQSNAIMRQVYVRMFVGLLITAFCALGVAVTPGLAMVVLGNKIVFWGMVIAMFAIAIIMPTRMDKMSTTSLMALFFVYSAIMGVFLAPIFYAYNLGTIAYTFFITAGVFGAMSVYGYSTNRDLTKIGSILFMALIGLIIASVVNMFVASSGLDWIISIVGVLIFVGLTAWDTQQIKKMAQQMPAAGVGRLATLGALSLYLDFINLFLFLLRIFGGGRD